MSGELVALVPAASFLAYIAFATRIRTRARSRGRRTIARGGTLAQALPYFIWAPYAVIALRPGPELALPDAVRWVGLGLVIAGVAFSMWAAATLGRHFDVEVEIHEGHTVVDHGPFRIVRHPVYLGLAVHYLGGFVATGNFLYLAGTLGVTLPALYYRASVEETLLRDALGAAYAGYARRVPMLVPFSRR